MGQLEIFLRQKLNMEKRCNNTSELDADLADLDRISNLPEELRVHILSFVKIKEAARTCVLSNEWKNTWTSLPILFLSLREFMLDRPKGLPIREHEDKFVKFVEALLQNRDQESALSHFILSSVTKDCASCNAEVFKFKGCILHALKFKPRFLALLFCKHKLLSSYEIFTCGSLQEVLFANEGTPNMEIAPNSITLPHLKRLDLAYVTVNDGFLDKLFLGCPIIEELFLHRCILNASRISSGRLKRLALWHCDFSKSGPDLINSLSNVTRLDLNVSGTEVKGLFEKGAHWPIFKNLKRLKLGGWCLNSDFDLVVFFLQSPNLERLTLQGYIPEEVATANKSNWEEPKVVTYQREWLEKVKIMKAYVRSEEWIDQLKKNLHDHVKTIGETKIV